LRERRIPTPLPIFSSTLEREKEVSRVSIGLKNRIVVIAIVPVTSIPKAKASLAELWKATTSASTAPINTQLMVGT
jgi:hypothetical protein